MSLQDTFNIMNLQDTFLSPPSTCFRLKSYWYNTWLGFDAYRNAAFSKQIDKSIMIFLLPCNDGRYMLQLVLDSLIELQELSNPMITSAMGCFQADGSGGVEFTDSELWFLCKQGQLMTVSQYAPEFHEDYCFSFEFDDYGCVALSSGISEERYWTVDSSSKLLFGVQNIGKRETFQLYEYDFSMVLRKVSMAPVRINLKAHTGKYLCCAAPVIGAAAEAPCCCEEFLLDVNFPPLLPHWKLCNGPTMCGATLNSRVRTGNGTLNWSAGSDGKLTIIQLDEAQGHENFTVEILSHKRRPMVSISHHFSEGCSDHTYYVGAEPTSRVTCNKLQKGKWEEFALEIANESRVLIHSVHGYFIGSQGPSTLIDAFSGPRFSQKSGTYEFSSKSSVVAWRLRAHGDSRYTLVAATCPSDRGDFYLHVDSEGKAMLSNEPAVHFPSSASLFEIKPVSRACLTGGSEGLDQQSKAKSAIVGFTIRTIRRINGKQRYFSAEPSGTLRVNSVHVSQWEIFQLVDVDATASAVLPNEFSCIPAAVNIPYARMSIAYFGPFQHGATVVQRMALSPLHQGQIGQELKCNHCWSGKPIQSVASMKRASQVAALATRMGQCLPTVTPASLQELCVKTLCLQVSADVITSEDKLLSVAWGTECLIESCLGVPDDLAARITAYWCSRQHPESSCKSLSSSSILDPSHNVGIGGQGPLNASEHPFWESSDEGFCCHSCNQRGVLKLSPIVNPAHHRYLEVQYHAQNGIARPSGFLWNLVSLAGVSIMSTALLCHFFAGGSKKQKSSTRAL